MSDLIFQSALLFALIVSSFKFILVMLGVISPTVWTFAIIAVLVCGVSIVAGNVISLIKEELRNKKDK